jgi:hypothetical protein
MWGFEKFFGLTFIVFEVVSTEQIKRFHFICDLAYGRSGRGSGVLRRVGLGKGMIQHRICPCGHGPRLGTLLDPVS